MVGKRSPLWLLNNNNSTIHLVKKAYERGEQTRIIKWFYEKKVEKKLSEWMSVPKKRSNFAFGRANTTTISVKKVFFFVEWKKGFLFNTSLCYNARTIVKTLFVLFCLFCHAFFALFMLYGFLSNKTISFLFWLFFTFSLSLSLSLHGASKTRIDSN